MDQVLKSGADGSASLGLQHQPAFFVSLRDLGGHKSIVSVGITR